MQEIFKTYQLNILSPLQLKDQPINVAILQFYQQGICPNELVQFFQKELYNTKILQKMDDVICTLSLRKSPRVSTRFKRSSRIPCSMY